jgi:hypothetical protein
MIRGRHNLKAGVDQRWMRMNWINREYPSGQYQFATSLTGDPQRSAGTGIGMATFLLGEVSGGQLVNRPHFSFESFTTSAYLQDDFKVTPRLTFNIGLRYDLTSSPAERWDRHSNFDPFVLNPETRMPGALTYSGVDAPRNFVDRDGNNFGPRFGFAYDLTGDGKTAVRAAYGVVYLLSETHDMQSASSNALGFESVTAFVSPTLGPFKAFSFSQGPTSLLVPKGAAAARPPTGDRRSSIRTAMLQRRTCSNGISRCSARCQAAGWFRPATQGTAASSCLAVTTT